LERFRRLSSHEAILKITKVRFVQNFAFDFSRQTAAAKSTFDMKNIKRMEIRMEEHEITIIRTRRKWTAFCESCRAKVVMLPPEAAAILAQSTSRRIFRRVEAGELHFLETREGALLVCCRSLELPQKA
jgi:hypothetical protein